MLTYDRRLPPGPRTVEYALPAEELGFRAVWCPEIPAFGHDIWVTIARIASARDIFRLRVRASSSHRSASSNSIRTADLHAIPASLTATDAQRSTSWLVWLRTLAWGDNVRKRRD